LPGKASQVDAYLAWQSLCRNLACRELHMALRQQGPRSDRRRRSVEYQLCLPGSVARSEILRPGGRAASRTADYFRTFSGAGGSGYIVHNGN